MSTTQLISTGMVWPSGLSYSDWINLQFALATRFHMQEPSGPVAVATNDALALGRDLVINGGFANWTGVAPNDSPDDWTTTQVGDATSNVTQNPAGQCQIISDGTQASVGQPILTVGKTYRVSLDVTVATSGQAKVIGFSGSHLLKASDGVQTVVFTDTATLGALSISRDTACNITVDNVVTQQTNIAASTDFSTPGDNPMDATNTALTVGVPSASSKVGFLYSGNATTAVLNRYSAEYNSFWTPDNLGVLMVAQVDTWAAGIDVLYRDGVDASNEVFILRSGADLTWTYEVGGVASTVTLVNAEALLGNAEFTIGLSADVDGVGLQAILNGAQVDTDQAIGSAIVGNLDPTMVVSFANASTAGNSWAGDGSRLVLAHRTPTLTEHADYHQRSGL